MGKYDSSLTRVVPVFDALMDRDPTGRSWLPSLLKLGSFNSSPPHDLPTGSLIDGHGRWWGKHERRLDSPKTLLRWLILNLKEPALNASWGGKETREKRELLVAGDPETQRDALALLDSQPAKSAWYILEGQSQPDAYLETESLILVVEGKRTEREATTSTAWMPVRSQMLRHMDAAYEIRGSKAVFGLMIVERQGGAEAIAPSEHWLTEAEAQVEPEMIEASLPHRSPDARAEIVNGFLGVTTWQRVCSEFHLQWPPAVDEL